MEKVRAASIGDTKVVFALSDDITVDCGYSSFENRKPESVVVDIGFFLNRGQCTEDCYKCCNGFKEKNVGKYEIGTNFAGLAEIDEFYIKQADVKINGRVIQIPVMMDNTCPYFRKKKCSLCNNSARDFYQKIPFLACFSPDWIFYKEDETLRITRRVCDSQFNVRYRKIHYENDVIVFKRLIAYYKSIGLSTETAEAAFNSFKEKYKKYEENIDILQKWW